MIRGKQFMVIIGIILLSFCLQQALYCHCQVPCGIYDDQMRIKMIAEHITTIEKAMNQVITLSKEAKPNYNQLARWVFNKEKHAEDLSGIITYYFMAQRIKIPEIGTDRPAYQVQLELLHHLLVLNMKAKQTTDISLIGQMRKILEKFEELYFKKK
jgi:nickel superoxide dismutase